jgi:hypothetical protein
VISPAFRCGSWHQVVSRLVLRIAANIRAVSYNSRSPLVAVDTRVEYRTGEQKTIGPGPRSTFVLICFRHMFAVGAIRTVSELWGPNICNLTTRLRPSTYRSLHLYLLD